MTVICHCEAIENGCGNPKLIRYRAVGALDAVITDKQLPKTHERAIFFFGILFLLTGLF